MSFTGDEMNLMCIDSTGGNRTGLTAKLTEMKRKPEIGWIFSVKRQDGLDGTENQRKKSKNRLTSPYVLGYTESGR